MKNPIIFVSLLAVAGTATTAKSAAAATSSDSVKEDLKQAVCFQDWDRAVELSSHLIASPSITPEHRQTLVNWRHRFSKYATSQTKFNTIPNCEGVRPSPVDIKVQPAPIPRFSNQTDQLSEYYCYQVEPNGYVQSLEHICAGKAPRQKLYW